MSASIRISGLSDDASLLACNPALLKMAFSAEALRAAAEQRTILHIARVADRYGEHLNSKDSVPMKIARCSKSAGNLFGSALTATERAGEFEAGARRVLAASEGQTHEGGS